MQKKIGYTIVPMSGYIFEKSEIRQFKDFVTTLSENRIKAKKDGNLAIDYVYKILMNSLYGRFSISLASTVKCKSLTLDSAWVQNKKSFSLL